MKILIAEKDGITRRNLAAILGKWGHGVSSVNDGLAALEILAGEDAPSLAILGFELPDANGIEICRRIRNEMSSKPIHLILLMPRDNDENAASVQSVLKAGADDFIYKPIDEDELRLRIRNGERIIELQRNLANRTREVETALGAIETAEDDLQNSRERQMLLESAIEQNTLAQIIETAKKSNVSILITKANLEKPGPEIVFANHAFTKMTGYELQEIAGKTPRILQGAQTDQAVLKRLRRSLSNGEKFFGETVNYRKDQTTYNLEWHISPLKLRSGEVTHFVAVQRDITSRKQVEAMLRESREYRNLFNLANDSIIIFDPKTEIVLNVNDKACENYCISRENFIGMSLKYISLDAGLDAKMLEELFATGAAEEFETVHLRGDGNTINVLINSSIVEFKGLQAVLSINRDVTERRRAEFKIKRAKQEWSDTVDAISDLILLEDVSGNVQRCNEAARDFFNLDYDDFIGQPLAKFLRVNENGGDALRAETWEGRIGAGEDWYEITNHQVPTHKGQSWVHIIKNISSRKQSEKILRRLSTAIEQAADGIVILDENGTIQFVNPAFERTSQFKRDELLEKQFFSLKDDSLSEAETAQIFEKIAKGAGLHDVHKSRRRNGEIYDEESTISPVRDGDGNVLNFVAVCRDITEKRRLESIAESVNMMENVGFVFSGIRHELGNPINSIKVALTVLKKNLETWQSEQIKTYIERCLSETTRVEYLLRALKTFSMHENPKMQTIDLSEFMNNFVALVESDFNRRGVSIIVENETTKPEAICDPRALHQIMLNLMANSADALDKTEIAQIIIRIKRIHRRISIIVEDNGAGMTETQFDNLFKPFYTSKPDGTGLGLVIVKKMIAKMNGTISISSELDAGTKARFTLEAA